MDISLENIEIKLVLDRPPCHSDTMFVIGIAREIWSIVFGRPRLRFKCRRDKGTQRQSTPGSLNAWLKARCNALRDAIQTTSDADTAVSIAERAKRHGLDNPGEEVAAEIEFNRAKLKADYLESLQARHLLSGECSAKDVSDARDWHAHFADLTRKRLQVASRRQSEVQRPRFPDMSGKTIFIHPNAGQVGLPPARTVAASFDMEIIESALLGADVLVMPSLGQMSQAITLVMVLNGGVVMDHRFFASKGEVGTCTTYNAAIIVGKPRFWWASSAFRRECKLAYTLLSHFSRVKKSVWHEIPDYIEFVEKKTLCRKQRRPLGAIGLVTTDQLRGGLAHFGSVFDVNAFIDKFRVVDAAWSAFGVCGM